MAPPLTAHSRTQSAFTCTWQLPDAAATVPKGALETFWLVRVDIDRPHAPHVHRAAEVRLTLRS